MAPAFASTGGTGNLVQLVADWSEEPQGLELTEVVTGTSGSPDLELPIEDLELSERPSNCLKRAQVNTSANFQSEADLLAITNFGQKSLDEIIDKLDEQRAALALKVGYNAEDLKEDGLVGAQHQSDNG